MKSSRIKLKLYVILYDIAAKVQSISHKRSFVFKLASKLKAKALGEILPF